MNIYLWEKYKGKYRILPEFDLQTHDLPRTMNGSIDPDYDDFYIDSSKPLKIYHGYRDILSCFVTSLTAGNNILKAIYHQEIKQNSNTTIENICNELVTKNIINDITFYDGEVLFSFKSNKLDQFAQILKLRTKGKNIHPLSKKNFSKINQYQIPSQDLNQYQNIVNNFVKKSKELDINKRRLSVARSINKITKNFLSKYTKTTNYKQMGMTNKEFIHSINQWEQYLKFLKTHLK